MNGQRVGYILSTSGKVYVKKSSGYMAAAYVGLEVDVDDMVVTLQDSYTTLQFDTGGMVSVNHSTVIRVVSSHAVENVTDYTLLQRLYMALGELWAKITKQQEEEPFETHGGIIGIKG